MQIDTIKNMSRKNIFLLILAAIIALATALAVKGRMSAQQAITADSPAPAIRVLVMQRDVAAGNFVRASQDLSWQPWPANAIQPSYIKEGSADLSNYDGAVARRPLKVGEPVTAENVVRPGAGGFLSAVLESGKRAISIAITPNSGTSGFIFPGDRVDLLVAHKVTYKESNQDPDEQTIVSETFLRDLRVVAVDQQLDNPENKAMVAKTITVEVTAKQAEQIAIAQQLGTVSFALRSLAKETKKDEAGAEGQEGQEATAQEADPLLNVLQDTADRSATFSSDSEISHLLNRKGDSMPHMLIIRGDSRERRTFYETNQ